MGEIIDTLLLRLSNKGLILEEVPWLIRDVLHIVSDEREPTLDRIQEKLANLGWSEQILAASTLEPITHLAENHEKAGKEGIIL